VGEVIRLDDPEILALLEEMLEQKKDEWKATFLDSGMKALEYLDNNPVDIVITDLKMPEMTGLELLEIISEKYPETIRIVLTAYVDQHLAMKATGFTHQYLIKPCTPRTLISTLERILVLRETLANDRLERLIARMESIPSLPAFYNQIVREIRKPDASLQRIGEIISQDIAMTAKILQLVNSSFFITQRRITDPVHAVSLLGLETVRGLVLTIHLFSRYKHKQMTGLSYIYLWEHSLRTARIAKMIAEYENFNREEVSLCYVSGLLHDVGKLVFAVEFPEMYYTLTSKAQKEQKSLTDIEYGQFKFSHAEVAAYLLALWGLPDGVIEAIAFHHRPETSKVIELSPVAVLHCADYFANRDDNMRIGAGDKMEEWDEKLDFNPA